MNQRKTFSNIKTGLTIAVFTTAAVSTMGAGASATEKHHAPQHANNKHSVSKQHDMHESKAAIDLRIGLKTLLQDHVTTNLVVNRSIAGSASEAKINSGIQAQIANSDALSAAVGSIYGPQAQAQFSEMFLEHIEESNNFAKAVALGDEAAKEAANEELREYLEEIATFFSTAIPVLSYDAVYGLLLEHEMLINKSTVAFEAGKNGQSRHFERKALKQVTVIADALASGIIATQPDKF